MPILKSSLSFLSIILDRTIQLQTIHLQTGLKKISNSPLYISLRLYTNLDFKIASFTTRSDPRERNEYNVRAKLKCINPESLVCVLSLFISTTRRCVQDTSLTMIIAVVVIVYRECMANWYRDIS